MTLPVPTPVGVVLIPESTSAATGASTAATASTSSAPAAATEGAVTLAQAYSALCTFIRDGCQLASASSSSPSSSAAAPSYSVLQSFHPSMSKQMKHLSRAGSADHPAAGVVLLLGSSELAANQVVFKNMRTSEQTSINLNKIRTRLLEATAGEKADAPATLTTDAPLTFQMLRDAYHSPAAART